MVRKDINKDTYKSDHPYTIQKHNVFHISLRDNDIPPTTAQPGSEPQPTIVDDSGEWEVDWMRNSTRRYRKLHYLVQWSGYSSVGTGWDPAENLRNVQESIDEYYRAHPRKPRQWLDFEERD